MRGRLTGEERAYRRGAFMALRLVAKTTRAGTDEVQRVGTVMVRAIDRQLRARAHGRG